MLDKLSFDHLHLIMKVLMFYISTFYLFENLCLGNDDKVCKLFIRTLINDVH